MGRARLGAIPMNARTRGAGRCRPLWILGLWLGCLGVASAAGVGGTAGDPEPFSWSRFLAPFHMVVLHLPIGVFASVMLLEGWAWIRPGPGRREAIAWMLGLGVTATAATMVLGFLRAMDGDYDTITLGRHRGWGIAASVLMAVSWGLHGHLLRHPARGGLVAFRFLLATGFLSLVVAGHHGGSLTHGSALLTEHAPGSLRQLLQSGAPSRKDAPPAAGAPGHGGFAEVQPVLASKCVSCHGPEKQKGGLRLDSRELALREGKSGRPGVVPGDPGRSEVIRACLLPAGHDEAMPPEGKERLTEAELQSVVRWIREGAR